MIKTEKQMPLGTLESWIQLFLKLASCDFPHKTCLSVFSKAKQALPATERVPTNSLSKQGLAE